MLCPTACWNSPLYLLAAACPALQDACRKDNVSLFSLKTFATEIREEHAAAFKAKECMEGREALQGSQFTVISDCAHFGAKRHGVAWSYRSG